MGESCHNTGKCQVDDALLISIIEDLDGKSCYPCVFMFREKHV